MVVVTEWVDKGNSDFDRGFDVLKSPKLCEVLASVSISVASLC